MEFNKTLGNKIKSIRKDKKLNQEEFCNKLNIELTRANLSYIESGKSTPSALFIKSIIETFNISPFELLNIEEPQKDKYMIKYESLNNKDKETINLMIDHLYSNYNGNLHTSMNTEENEENKKSS